MNIKHLIRECAARYIVSAMPEEEILGAAKAVVEKRFQRGVRFTQPSEAKDYLVNLLCTKEHEVFACLFLDNKHRLIKYEEMFRGTTDGASVYPREVAKEALAVNASAVIFAHNHPSGDTEPSDNDKRITKRLCEALELVDIRVLDHLIVGGLNVISLAERGYI